MTMRMLALLPMVVAAQGPSYRFDGALYVGQISLKDWDPSDVFWSEGTLCVAQGKKGELVRCFDPASRKWGGKVARKSRPRDQALTINEGAPSASASGLGEGACPVEVGGLSDPMVERLEREKKQREMRFEELNCGVFDDRDSCSQLNEPGKWGRGGCPNFVLLSADKKLAAVVTPFVVTWMPCIRCDEQTEIDHLSVSIATVTSPGPTSDAGTKRP